DVRDHAIRGRGGEGLGKLVRQRAHGRTGEACRGALERPPERLRHPVDRPELDRPLQALAVAPEPDHLHLLELLPRGKADRAADQPDAENGDPHPASRRALTAAANPSKTPTVVSQSMHASVIDWP